jgi:hypothetical protein
VCSTVPLYIWPCWKNKSARIACVVGSVRITCSSHDHELCLRIRTCAKCASRMILEVHNVLCTFASDLVGCSNGTRTCVKRATFACSILLPRCDTCACHGVWLCCWLFASMFAVQRIQLHGLIVFLCFLPRYAGPYAVVDTAR